MIEILSVQSHTEPLTGETFRHVEIIISDNGNAYLWAVGGLPAEGDLQAILDAREVELLQAASNTGQANTPELTERRDFSGLEQDINNELVWIGDTLATIDTMTQAQVRNVIKRILQEQQRELKAWRYVIRRLR
jgi:hypothetical protein